MVSFTVEQSPALDKMRYIVYTGCSILCATLLTRGCFSRNTVKDKLVGLIRECVFIRDGRLFLPHAFYDTCIRKYTYIFRTNRTPNSNLSQLQQHIVYINTEQQWAQNTALFHSSQKNKSVHRLVQLVWFTLLCVCLMGNPIVCAN